MKYNFDKLVDRSLEYSAKYDEVEVKYGASDLIPLWIADMDLKVADPILDAMKKRVESGIFGYTTRPDKYNEAVCKWLKDKHNWLVEKETLMFSPGVIPSISILLQELTEVGDNIIIQEPVYSPFSSVVKNTKRELRVNPLTIDSSGDYVMDLANLESQMDENTKFLILCNPHNPVGRVWKLEELQALAKVCLKHGVKVISDEIHSDLIFSNHKHIPFASISKEAENITITCFAPSKTFNVPGLQASVIAIPNKETYQIIDQAFNTLDIKRNNCFSMVATHAAYSHGHEWLEQAMEYIESNADYIVDYIGKYIPKISVKKPDGTYLLWLNCKELGLNDTDLRSFMINDAKLALNNGCDFGIGGSGYQRINIACPRSILEKALEQLKVAVNNLNI